jgi:hypothetical protein
VKESLPTYCPLALEFDAARLEAELEGLRPQFGSLATTRAMIDRRADWFPLGDDALHAAVEHVAIDASGRRTIVPGRVPSWRGTGLTHVPDRPDTASGGSRHRRSFDGRWRWKEELKIPYTRRLIKAIGLERVDNVRAMSLPKGGFGPVHVDWENEAPWETERLVSITFLLRDGGVPMRFRAPDGRVHDVSDRVFFFKDCAPHGVPRATSDRMLLRVNGAMARERFASLMRIEHAIW